MYHSCVLFNIINSHDNQCIILYYILMMDNLSISREIAMRWISQDLTDDKSTLVQVIDWCHQHCSGLSWKKSLVLIRILIKQGKSEGFESCDRPIVRKRPIWVKIGDVLYRVTLKFDGWPWKTIGHLSFAVSSFVQHFMFIGEFKLELQSGNAPIWVKFDDF